MSRVGFRSSRYRLGVRQTRTRQWFPPKVVTYRDSARPQAPARPAHRPLYAAALTVYTDH